MNRGLGIFTFFLPVDSSLLGDSSGSIKKFIFLVYHFEALIGPNNKFFLNSNNAIKIKFFIKIAFFIFIYVNINKLIETKFSFVAQCRYT